MQNKRVFTATEVKLVVVRPSAVIENKAQLVYGKAFREAVEAGLMVRPRLESYLREQGLWDDAKDAEYKAVLKRLRDNEKKIAAGGNAGLTRKKLRTLAIEMRRDRATLMYLNRDRSELDLNTAEAIAEQRKFEHYVATCTLHEDTGKPYFESLEAYKNGGELADVASLEFGKLYYNLDDNREKNLPENLALSKYNLVDEKLRLIDDKGNLVNAEGERVDEFGRRVNDTGDLIDIDGTPMDAEGNYKIEWAELLPDEDEASPEADPPVLETPELGVEPGEPGVLEGGE